MNFTQITLEVYIEDTKHYTNFKTTVFTMTYIPSEIGKPCQKRLEKISIW